MQNPIPSPRPSSDPLYRARPTLPRRQPLVGPACPPVAHHHPQRTPSAQSLPPCDHRSCRERRAQHLLRLGGHRSEYSREHTQAAQLQARHRHLILYFGEATQSFWIASPAGLEEAADIDALLLKLWPHTASPAARPWARSVGEPRALTMA